MMDQPKPPELDPAVESDLAALERETRRLHPDLFRQIDEIFGPDVDSSTHPRDIEQHDEDMLDCNIDSDVDMFEDQGKTDKSTSAIFDKLDKPKSSQSETVEQSSAAKDDRRRTTSLPTESVFR